MAQIQSGAAGLAKGAGKLIFGAFKGALGIAGSVAGRVAGPLRSQIPGMKSTTSDRDSRENSATMMKLAGDDEWYPGPMIPGGG